MGNDPPARHLLELSDQLAASLVAFSGRESADQASSTQRVAFESTIDMIVNGFEPTYGGLTTILTLDRPEEPAYTRLRKDRLFDPAFRDSTAVLCLYMHGLARNTMNPTDADRFDSRLQSSVARLCAGQFGFDRDAPDVFETIQRLIHAFLSDTWINAQSPGKDDCLGKVLEDLSLSPDRRTRYAFVVGSQKQPTGCAARFIRALGRARTLFSASM